MCQLNLYMVPKSVSKEEIINIFEKYNLYISGNSYYKLDEFVESYEIYAANCGCDCRSIISSLQDVNVSNFDEYKIKKKNEDTEKLNKMKNLKDSKDYETKVKEFENNRNKLWEIVDNFSKHIRDYEIQEKEKIFALNLKEDEECKMMDEILYPKLNEMHEVIYKSKEYNNALEEYQDYITKNADLNESTYYDIEENEKTINEYDFSDLHDQFSDLKNIFTEILKLTKEIYIYPFWQDDEPLEIKDKRQIVIENFSIEDLVFLPYRNLLQIGTIKDSY